MELHRRGYGLFGWIILVGGGRKLIGARIDSLGDKLSLVAGICFVALGCGLLFERFRPFRFHIGADGLTLRTKGINRLVGWSEIHAVVLVADSPTSLTRRLLLVPGSSDFDAKLNKVSPVDGMRCLELLDFDDVKEKFEEVALTLSRFGGARFVDARA